MALAGCAAMKAHQPASVPQPVMPVVFLLFFDPSSADLPTDGKAIVDQAAAKVNDTHPSTVTIAAYTANVGAAGDRGRLAQQRIATVRKALIDDGVAPGLFLDIPLGTPDDTAGPTGDRRIEIRLQYGG
jgi:outer membrane protein OmpA-like peptidoglycan-associated protein